MYCTVCSTRRWKIAARLELISNKCLFQCGNVIYCECSVSIECVAVAMVCCVLHAVCNVHCIRLPTLIRCVGRTQTGDSQQQQINGNPSTKSQMNACALSCNRLIRPFYWTRIHVVLLLTFCPLRKCSQGKWQCWYWNTIDCIGVCRARVYVSVLCGCCGVWTLYIYGVVQYKCLCRWEFILSILIAYSTIFESNAKLENALSMCRWHMNSNLVLFLSIEFFESEKHRRTWK